MDAKAEESRLCGSGSSRHHNDNNKNNSNGSIDTNNEDDDDDDEPPHSALPLLSGQWRPWSLLPPPRPVVVGEQGRRGRVVPSAAEQLVRAGLYTAQFSVAYVIMLLAMYYNGYIILCIFGGAFIGFFVFAWDVAGMAPAAGGGNAACCA